MMMMMMRSYSDGMPACGQQARLLLLLLRAMTPPAHVTMLAGTHSPVVLGEVVCVRVWARVCERAAAASY